eukprot:UN30747
MVWNLTISKDQKHTRTLISNLHLKTKLIGHSSPITLMKYSNTYSVLVSTAEDNTVLLWNMNTYSVLNCLEGFPSKIIGLSIENVSGHIFVATKQWITAWSMNGV